jgi:hypothetical protein
MIMGNIFISYRRKDSQQVDALQAALAPGVHPE